jgi:hypothetical protein
LVRRTGRRPPGKLRKACRDLYRQAPTKAEAEELGLTLEEATAVVNLWPDNLDSINTFVSMLTQWRMGPNGAVGLDYGVLPAVLKLNGLPEDRFQALFSDIRVLEDQALQIIRKKK